MRRGRSEPSSDPPSGGPTPRVEDDIATIVIPRSAWLPPVARPTDLPRTGVPEGALCYVDAEEPDGDGDEQIWQFVAGAWVLVG